MAINGVKISELPNSQTIEGDDLVVAVVDGVTVNMTKEDFAADIGVPAPEGLLWNSVIQGYMVKAAGNLSITTLEVNDVVWYVDVDFNGTTLTLMGWRYDGGDVTLQASYTKVKSLA
jgi:hypothetical protein